MESSGRAINSPNLFYDYGWYFILFFLKGIGNEFESLLVWICNISWQLGLFHLFVLPIWSRSVKGDRELLEHGYGSVLRWAVSLICSFNLLPALQQREAGFLISLLHHLAAS